MTTTDTPGVRQQKRMCFTAGRKATLRQMRERISDLEDRYQKAKREWQECPTAENNVKMIRADALVDDQMSKMVEL